MQRRISTEADVHLSNIISRLDARINLHIEPDEEPKTPELSQENHGYRNVSPSEQNILTYRTNKPIETTSILHCLVKEVGERNMVLLVRTLSLTQQVIYFDSSSRKESAVIRCFQRYRANPCVLVSHTSFKYESCSECVKNFLPSINKGFGKRIQKVQVFGGVLTARMPGPHYYKYFILAFEEITAERFKFLLN